MTCEPAERVDGRRRHDLTLAIVATIVFALLSLPAHWGFDFWAESEPLWIAYFAVGALLSVYVLLAFIRATRSLLGHEHHDDPGQP